jgi:hypothetical protein
VWRRGARQGYPKPITEKLALVPHGMEQRYDLSHGRQPRKFKRPQRTQWGVGAWEGVDAKL